MMAKEISKYFITNKLWEKIKMISHKKMNFFLIAALRKRETFLL